MCPFYSSEDAVNTHARLFQPRMRPGEGQPEYPRRRESYGKHRPHSHVHIELALLCYRLTLQNKAKLEFTRWNKITIKLQHSKRLPIETALVCPHAGGEKASPGTWGSPTCDNRVLPSRARAQVSANHYLM